MPFLGNALLAIGGLFLSHACYSAHEHTHLPLSNAAIPPPSEPVRLPGLTGPSFTISNLPTDITIEVIAALFLLCMGIVMSSENFKPIRWNEWAAEVEHGEHGEDSKLIRKPGDREGWTAEQLGQELYGGPSQEGFGYLENGRRMGFFDIRTERKKFADKLRKGGEIDQKKQ